MKKSSIYLFKSGLVTIFIFNLILNSKAVPSIGTHIMMAGPSPYAVEVGKVIAKRGGNAVDVAVAMGLTLSVTSPYFAALGGGGFALIKQGKNSAPEALDFREVAPLATSPQFFVNKGNESSITGGAAIGVPGFPAGLWAMHKKYGKLKWEQLFPEVLQLAERGFQVSGEWYEKAKMTQNRFNSYGKKYFYKKSQSPFLPGETFTQPQLARALRIFRDLNVKGFYEGDVAHDIVNTVKKSGGVITLKDLKDYRVRWMKPLEGRFNGYDVYSMPPPSSGGIVIETALNLVERIKLEKQKLLSIPELHLMGEILSRSYRGRVLLGDPDFHQNPLKYLLSETYLKEMADSIKWTESVQLKPLKEEEFKESQNTTHFSVLDKDGNSVALTVTLNGAFGSAVVSQQYGIALNNEMDDFTTHPNEPNMYGLIQGSGNEVQPHKRPLSSMSPTLIVKNNQVVMSVGSPGGPRIISGVIQVIYRSLVNGLNVDEAIQTPRIHHQFLPHVLYVDKNRWSPEVLEGLSKLKHQVEESWMGRVYAIKRNEEGFLEAAHDLRGEGASGGY